MTKQVQQRSVAAEPRSFWLNTHLRMKF